MFKEELSVGEKKYTYYDINKICDLLKLEKHIPITQKLILENIFRNYTFSDLQSFISEFKNKHIDKKNDINVHFMPTRVLMQDFTGIPAIADLASLQQALLERGCDPSLVNPIPKVDLVIDHSLNVDFSGTEDAFEKNALLEFERNKERYTFLKWAQNSFRNLRIIPPGNGICHQINLEFLGEVVSTSKDEDTVVSFPDMVIGTDSHTTMINALGVLGWGVGGIEAESVMLGKSLSFRWPEVIGVSLKGRLPPGATITDLALTLTEFLRLKNVVNKYIEFYGEGVSTLSLADRSTISNMAPEYGATCAYFPIDEETLEYLAVTGRSQENINLIEVYAKKQGIWQYGENPPLCDDHYSIDLSEIKSCVAGPTNPQQRVELSNIPLVISQTLKTIANKKTEKDTPTNLSSYLRELEDGDIVVAAITSCTNTSNPASIIGAALFAKNAVLAGLKSADWIKTSFSPGSKTVGYYLSESHLDQYLNKLGFNIVGFGCGTCTGNSGDLNPIFLEQIEKNNLSVCAILSGNRNFPNRIHPQVRMNFLASPILVVAYSLIGTMNCDLLNDPLGYNKDGKPVFLSDLWPSEEEIKAYIKNYIKKDIFYKNSLSIHKGNKYWDAIEVDEDKLYSWDASSTYIKCPPFSQSYSASSRHQFMIEKARILLILGNSITTDHISPVGRIPFDGPAGRYLIEKGIKLEDFNSFGSRRGNHEVMVRGTFSNARIQNLIIPEKMGAFTYKYPEKKLLEIYEAAMTYKDESVPLVVIAGKEYGSGSSRDWAAKGAYLLGIKIIIAESFEKIHRSNLIGMGILPLTFKHEDTCQSLELSGDEVLSISWNGDGIYPFATAICQIENRFNEIKIIHLNSLIYNEEEKNILFSGGILPLTLNELEKNEKHRHIT